MTRVEIEITAELVRDLVRDQHPDLADRRFGWAVRRATPGPHLMLRLALSDGRVLVAAGAHPTADGTYLRQLRMGQRYDGATVVSIGWTPSTAPATYDILPAGPTGTYWANGILIGSTLNQVTVP